MKDALDADVRIESFGAISRDSGLPHRLQRPNPTHLAAIEPILVSDSRNERVFGFGCTATVDAYVRYGVTAMMLTCTTGFRSTRK